MIKMFASPGLAVALSLLFGVNSGAKETTSSPGEKPKANLNHADKPGPVPVPAKTYQVECLLGYFSEDGRDVGEKRNVRLLAQPRMMILEGHPFSFRSGGEIPILEEKDGVAPFGLLVVGNIKNVGHGNVFVDVLLENSILVEPPGDKGTKTIEGKSIRVLKTQEVGKPLKILLGNGEDGEPTGYLRITIEETNPSVGASSPAAYEKLDQIQKKLEDLERRLEKLER